jgi:hypothetical protein
VVFNLLLLGIVIQSYKYPAIVNLICVALHGAALSEFYMLVAISLWLHNDTAKSYLVVF